MHDHGHDHDQIVPNVTLQAPNFDQNQLDVNANETSEEESYHGSYMSVTLLLVGRSQIKKKLLRLNSTLLALKIKVVNFNKNGIKKPLSTTSRNIQIFI